MGFSTKLKKQLLIFLTSFPVLIFLVALVIRLVPVLITRTMGIGLDDMFQYDMLARSIATGNGYRWYAQPDLHLAQQYIHFNMSMVNYDPRGVLTSFRPPLYPFFLATIYYVFGMGVNRFYIARLIQTILVALLVPMVYNISSKLFPSNIKIGRISAYIVAFYPILVIYPLSLATENIFFILFLLALWTTLKAVKTDQWYWYAISGLLFGLTALTRSVALSVAGFTFLFIVFMLKKPKNGFILLAMVIITTLPWMIRNTIINHHITGIESALGYDLYMGYHPKSNGTFQYGISMDLIPYLDDGLRDKIGQDKAIEFIKANPWRVPVLMVNRLGYFFGLERRALTYFYANNFFGYIPESILIIIAVVLLSPFVILSISAAFGFTIYKWDSFSLLVLIFFFGYLLPHILILGEDRFHFTLIPVMAIFAAFFWTEGRKRIHESWKSPSGKIALLIASAICVLLIIGWSSELFRDRVLIFNLFSPSGNQLYIPY